MFTGQGNQNQGSITTSGGQIEFFRDLENKGKINVTGASTLRFGGGVEDNGNVAISFSTVIAAWHTLPDAVKAGILAMVKTTHGGSFYPV